MVKRNPDQFLDFSVKSSLSQTKEKSTNVSNNNSTVPFFVATEDQFLQDPQKIHEQTLAKINAHYRKGIKYFRQGKMEKAEQELVHAMKPVLNKNTEQILYVELKDCKEQMLDAMYHLGKIYERSNKYQDNYSKSTAIFQYCAGFAKKYEISTEIDYLKEAYEMEAKFLVSIGVGDKAKSYESYQKQINYYKEGLAIIRATAGTLVEKIRNWPIERIEERTKAVEEIYAECTSFFVNHTKLSDSNSKQIVKPGLVQQLLIECYEQLGPVPKGCEYAIIGFGSLAGGKMTPWSDLEFGILINEDTPEYKEYFRNLTKLLHIKVINLGETPLRSVGIESLNNFKIANKTDDWFWDEVTNNGFSFDGPDWYACKLPLGRQGYKAEEQVKNKDGVEKITVEKPDYELITTPAQMAKFQGGTPSVDSEVDDETIFKSKKAKIENWYASDKHLVQALKSVALIDGSQSLLDTYRKTIREAEDKKMVQARALEILKEDVANFSLKLGDEEEGKLFDVKKGIYRVGDRIVEALANYYGIEPEPGQPSLTVWQAIDKMATQKLLSQEGAKHLKEAISIATELRLATYYHNKGQKESASIYIPVLGDLTEAERKKLSEETFIIKDTSILHHFYHIVLRLQLIAKGLIDEQYHDDAKNLLTSDFLIDYNEHIKGLIHARFLEYEKALEYIKASKEEMPEDLEILNSLFFLQDKTGKVDDALATAKQMLFLSQKKYKDNPNHPNIAASYDNLGIAYYAKGEYEEAVKNYKQALAIMKQIHASNPVHLDIAASYNNLGAAYNEKGEYDVAIKYHKLSLYIKQKVHANNPAHLDIAASYNNLGAAYNEKGEYDVAIEYHKLSLYIKQKVHANNPAHPDIAASYNNLGAAYKEREEYDAAIKYFKDALEIRIQVYGSTSTHPDIATSYNNLGNVYYVKGEYDAAIKYFKDTLAIQKQVYASDPAHPDIAVSYNNLGNVYYGKGDYIAAIKYYKKALKIREQVYTSIPTHPDIGASYNNLGMVYLCTGDFEKAYNYSKQALEIFAINGHQQNIAMAYRNYWASVIQLSILSFLQNDYNRAKKYLLELGDSYKDIDFFSPKSVELLFEHMIFVYEANALPACINCQKALLKSDPELKYDNHYHNLACFYAAAARADEANELFNQALRHNVKASIHVEYAQFLLQNISSLMLAVESQEVLKHLRAAFDSNDNSELQYGKLEKNSVCIILRNIIAQKNSTVQIKPVVLAHYLLVKYAEYLGVDDEEVLKSLEELTKLSNNSQDEISFRLLSNACAEIEEEQQAKEYEKYAELIDKIEKIVMGSASVENMVSLNKEDVQKYADNVQKVAKLALTENRLNDVKNLYEKLFNLQNSYLIKTGDLRVDFSITDKLATICLLVNDLKLFTDLKMYYKAKISADIVNLAGKSLDEFLVIDHHITKQIKAALLQQQLADNPHQTITVEAIDDTEDAADEVKPAGG